MPRKANQTTAVESEPEWIIRGRAIAEAKAQMKIHNAENEIANTRYKVAELERQVLTAESTILALRKAAGFHR